MADNVGSFVRQLILEKVTSLLDEIDQTNFNTEPFVTNDPRTLVGREDRDMLLVLDGAEDVVEVAVGGCHQMSLTIEIYGYAQVDEGEAPVKELNRLLQDVRQKIHTDIREVAEYCDRGLAFRFGSTETDAGALAHNGQAAFIQNVLFEYKNGKDW